ncbi:YcaO-like family protein [Sphingomonas sp. LHG3443-2]|uniref:YcaO-like family protein n=1 Tax=Sphingomonas sp. LHG3443-2 TaxID=2804639 RepID=UPI003CECA1C3
MTGLPPHLPPAAAAYRDAFPPGELVAFPLTELDNIGIPVWVVALFPDDPALDGIMPYGVGYGRDEGQAVLGALGEIAEMVFPTLSLSARTKTRGSYVELATVLGERSVADPLTLCLPAGSLVGRHTPLDWVEATRWGDGSTVLVPIDLAAYSSKELSPHYRPFTTIISNGMGAGPDLEWAVGHGLLELLQRDGNGLLFRALDQGVLLDLPAALPPQTQALLHRYEAAGIEIMPKFATDEFGIANLYCVGRERGEREPPTPIMLTGCGEAAHPDRGQALDKALCEFAASRARKAFAHGPRALAERVAPAGYVERFLARSGAAAKSSDPRAFRAMAEWTQTPARELAGWLSDNVHSVQRRKSFAELPAATIDDGSARARATIDAVTAAGMDLLYVDMSPPGVDLACVKVIVPGLEVETMSYARIGERNTRKLLDRDLGLVGFGPTTPARRPVRLTEEALDRLGGQPWFDVERAAELVGPLYPLYREPEAHHVAAAVMEPA